MSPRAWRAPDGGWGWAIVFGAFCINFCIDGVTYAFGVLAAELTEALDCSRQLNGWIASVMVGVSFGGGPLASAACAKFGRRRVAVLGSAVAASGFAASYWVDEAWLLVLTVGAVAGLGMSLICLASTVCVGLYFDKRRSTALGIAMCGSGCGTLVFGPVISHLIDCYTWRGTMLILSGVLLNCAVFAALFRPLPVELPVKGQQRLLTSGEAEEPPSKDSKLLNLSLMRSPSFVLFLVSNLLCNVGFNAPFLYMPDRARRAGNSLSDSSLLVSIIGAANMAGRVCFGLLADSGFVKRLTLYNAALIVAGCSLVFSFASELYAFMAVYCFVFGAFIGAKVTLTSPVLVDLLGVERLSDSFGLTLLFQGTGVLIGPPIAGFIFDSTASFDLPFVVCGACVLISGLMLTPVPCVVQKCEDESEDVVS